MGLELTLVSFIFLGYPRAFRTSRSKRGTRRPGKCLTILSSSVSPCTYTHTSFLSLSVCPPLLIPLPILASSSVVRDVKDVARVLGGTRKDQVRPLERKRRVQINQGQHGIQPGLDFGEEGRKEM